MQFIIKITNRCNLDCIYCFEKKRMRQTSKRFSLSVMEALLTDIVSYHEKINDKHIRIQFTGGEPLSIPDSAWTDYLELIRNIIPSSFTTSLTIQTNLYRLSSKMIDLIQEHDVGIGCSVDFTDKTRLTIKGKPSQSRVMNNLNHLLELGIPFGLLCVVSRHNIDLLEDIYDFMLENHLDFYLQPLNRTAYKYQRSLLIDPEEYAEKLFVLIEKYVRDKNAPMSFANAINYSNDIFKIRGPKHQCIHTGRCGENFVAVRADGSVFVCPTFEVDEYVLGNFLKQPLSKILSPRNPILRKYRNRVEEATKFNSECKTCRWRMICKQGCPYESYLDGDMMKKSTFQCRANRIIYPRLIKLYRELGYNVRT